MSFRNRGRELVLRGWAKLRGKEVKIERYRYIDGPEGRAQTDVRIPKSPDESVPAWGDGDEKDIRKEVRRPERDVEDIDVLAEVAREDGWPGSSDESAVWELRRRQIRAEAAKRGAREDLQPLWRRSYRGRLPHLPHLPDVTREEWSLAAQEAALRGPDADPDAPELEPIEDLTLDERRLLAAQTASTISHTLALLFLRLGPPPEGASGDASPVTSGGGGAQQ
ncbi:hypothetical protein [Streptomyces sp. OK228]|uniref:hypothetical protein n=1 Tax=Streptomyces sp. OK228 TaxID=1882786 RepID=UPI001180A82B|nr:hypothetical protein [Streptomyces sp. OK228]